MGKEVIITCYVAKANRVVRYEFAQNEFVTCVECVTLETLSTETGTKDFVAVSTTINRGEDLAVKGAVGTSRLLSTPPRLILL